MKDIVSYLKLFFNATYLPLYYYQNNRLLFQIPETGGYSFPDCFRHMLTTSEKTLDFLITENNLYLGIIRNFSTDVYIMVGPVCAIRPKQDMLLKILIEFSISIKYKADIDHFFRMTPTFSLNQFLHLLSVLNVYINDEMIDPTVCLRSNSSNSFKALSEAFSSKLYEAKETENFHNTYHFEQKVFHYVEKGNVEELKAFLENSHNIHSGIIGETPLRLAKNALIVNTSLIARHSIYGGLDIETAYQLNDLYIMEAEKATSEKAIINLTYEAMLDFAKRVAENQIPSGMSPDVFRCIQFIATHTNQSISVTDVAKAIGKSTSLISKKFKKELGFNLCDFIMRRKLEEGKSLLLYSDKSINEISEYLCFSSQSYFQTVFKKQYGMTPLTYRNEAVKKTPNEKRGFSNEF